MPIVDHRIHNLHMEYTLRMSLHRAKQHHFVVGAVYSLRMFASWNQWSISLKPEKKLDKKERKPRSQADDFGNNNNRTRGLQLKGIFLSLFFIMQFLSIWVNPVKKVDHHPH